MHPFAGHQVKTQVGKPQEQGSLQAVERVALMQAVGKMPLFDLAQRSPVLETV